MKDKLQIQKKTHGALRYITRKDCHPSEHLAHVNLFKKLRAQNKNDVHIQLTIKVFL